MTTIDPEIIRRAAAKYTITKRQNVVADPPWKITSIMTLVVAIAGELDTITVDEVHAETGIPWDRIRIAVVKLTKIGALEFAGLSDDGRSAMYRRASK